MVFGGLAWSMHGSVAQAALDLFPPASRAVKSIPIRYLGKSMDTRAKVKRVQVLKRAEGTSEFGICQVTQAMKNTCSHF